jgi:hypothetical protein
VGELQSAASSDHCRFSEMETVSENGFMQTCSGERHNDLRVGSNVSTSFKFLSSSQFSTEKSAPVIAWKIMIFYH